MSMHKVLSALAGALLGVAVSTAAFLLLRPPGAFPRAVPHAEAATVRDAALPRVASSAEPVAVPILVYHIVRPAYPNDSVELKKYRVTPEVFDAELAHLSAAGYHVIGFQQLEAHFASSTPLPNKPVILSFDDAWEDQYRYAFPILKKYHDAATFFVFTNAIDSRGFFTVSELKTMIAAGMTIGDHSKSHPYFTNLTATSSLVREIVDTKRALETEFGVPVIAFAYPFGQYNPRVLAYVQRAGFLFGRGDGWHGPEVSPATRYTLSALNAPLSLADFEKYFP